MRDWMIGGALTAVVVVCGVYFAAVKTHPSAPPPPAVALEPDGDEPPALAIEPVVDVTDITALLDPPPPPAPPSDDEPAPPPVAVAGNPPAIPAATD